MERIETSRKSLILQLWRGRVKRYEATSLNKNQGTPSGEPEDSGVPPEKSTAKKSKKNHKRLVIEATNGQERSVNLDGWDYLSCKKGNDVSIAWIGEEGSNNFSCVCVVNHSTYLQKWNDEEIFEYCRKSSIKVIISTTALLILLGVWIVEFAEIKSDWGGVFLGVFGLPLGLKIAKNGHNEHDVALIKKAIEKAASN